MSKLKSISSHECKDRAHQRGQLEKVITQRRIFLLLSIVLLLQSRAFAFGQGVTLALSDTPLNTVFREIEKQTKYEFIYPSKELYSRKVSISVTNASIDDVMRICLKGLPFTWYVNDNRIVVTKKTAQADNTIESGSAVGIPIDLTGKILNEKGEPVAGATITVKGTEVVTASGPDGSFSIQGVDNKAAISVSSVGYLPRTIRLSGENSITIRLEVAVQQMKEVVVSTGYQKIKTENFVGSYAQLDSSNYHRRAGMSIIDRLEGTVPGVMFDKKGGGFPLQIRGISTLNLGSSPTSPEPLIILDDFPLPTEMSLSNINPNDVENITVLKDAAAASIWGARAGNGVIVINTKSAKFNRKLQVNFSSNVSIENKVDQFFVPRISITDFIDIEKELYGKGFYDLQLNDQYTYPLVSPVVELLDRESKGIIDADQLNTEINKLRGLDLRNELNDHLYRKPVLQQHYLSVGGGTNNMSYHFSFGYNNSDNRIRGSKSMQQYTINSRASMRPVKNLEINTGLNLSFTDDPSNNFSLPYTSPYVKLKEADGSSAAIPFLLRSGYLDTVGGGKLLDWKYRPLDEVRFANTRTQTRFTQLELNASYQLFPWLKAGANFQYVTSSANTRDLKDLNMFETRDLINRFTNFNEENPFLRYPVPVGATLDIFNSLSKSINLRGVMSFNKNWKGGLHQVNGLVSAELSDRKGQYSDWHRVYGYNDQTNISTPAINYFTPYPLFYAATPGMVGYIPVANGYVDNPNNRTVSFLANASYTFDNIYTVYASGRRDGSNVFGVNTNNKWKPLWSVGLGYEISKEKFFNVDFVSYLKLKSSYGYTGNVNTNISGRLIFKNSPNPDRFTGLPYTTPGIAPNPDLRWEEVRMTNIGVEFQVLKNRINGSMEFYWKKAKDLIAFLPMAPTTGVRDYTLNYANMEGNGFDMTLQSQNITGKFNWSTNLFLSFAKTRVTKLHRQSGGFFAKDFVQYALNATEGQIAFALASYKWAGLDPLTGDPQGIYDNKPSKDYNAILNDSIGNQVFHGSSVPLLHGALMNTLSFKGFTLSFNISGKFKFYFREPVVSISHSGEYSGNSYLIDYYNRWQKPGDELRTSIPSINFPESDALRNSFYEFSDKSVKRGDNIRLQDFRLNYQLPNKINRKTLFQNAQVFIYTNAINWILWRADDSHYDPEFVGGFGSMPAPPPPRVVTLGINMSL